MASLVANADIHSHLKQGAESLPSVDILGKSVELLLGVTSEAKTALAKLGIESIFDLATSVVFNNAVKLINGASDPNDALYRYGKPPSDLVRSAAAKDKTLQELSKASIKVLTSVPEKEVEDIAKTLNTESVRDLSLYPPFVTAANILKQLYFPQSDRLYDPELPADLVPKTGEYPIEKVQYATLHMNEIKATDANNLTDILDSAKFAPPSLDVLAKLEKDGYKTVAMGALLTFTQSWFAQGVTLGHLLHSATLAPGESTRVAVIDWSRKQRAGQTEQFSQNEDLVNDSNHTRAIAEVTRGVAREAQSGFSSSNTNAESDSEATATSRDFNSGISGAVVGGGSYTEGTSNNESSSSVQSDSFSSTFGSREVASRSMQSINDRTHQHASSSRNRRASVVKEVSQSEHEAVSTRVIANYNHAHALSINYYEVVQIFRVEVRLAKAEQVIFIPLALPNFQNVDIVRRFQTPLTRAALDPHVRQAMTNMDTVELDPVRKTSFTIFQRPLSEVLADAIATRSSLTAGTRILPRFDHIQTPKELPDKLPNASSPTVREGHQTPGLRSDHPSSTLPIVTSSMLANPPRISAVLPTFNQTIPVLAQANKYLWDQDNVATLSRLLGRPILLSTSPAIRLPIDCSIEGANAEGNFEPGYPVKAGFKLTALEEVTITNFGPGQKFESIQMRDLSSIVISGSSPTADYDVTITLSVNRGGVLVPVRLPTVRVPRGSSETPVVNARPGGINADVTKHLMAHRLYYSQVVFRSLDATDIALLLSGYSYKLGDKVVPVVQLINPRPIRYIGNYLAFTTNVQSYKDNDKDKSKDIDPDWTKFLDEKGITVGTTSNDVVPLGTGGVFAEAILGRANCAEKLDITRFWDWKESPIPLQPTEIAAINTGSRATQENLSTGALDAPLVSQQAASALPDPIGTAALLTALQNGSMFRDQSGLAATIGLTQAALQATQQGTAAAGQTAGQALQSQLQATTERQKTAANMITDLAKVAASAYTGIPIGVGSGESGISASNSGKGALINYFDKTQDNSGATANSNQSGSAAPVDLPGYTGRDPGSQAGVTSARGQDVGTGVSSSGTGYSLSSSGTGYSQNPAARSAVGGNDVLSSFLSKAGDMASTILAAPTRSQPEALSERRAWPYLDSNEVLPRIDGLKANGWRFNQGSLALCTVGAFFYHCFTMKPEETAQFAKTLYDVGQATLGSMEVKPRDDLRNSDYNAVFMNAGLKIVPPQADWMLMCSVRDSKNWTLAFEGDPSEEIAMLTSSRELEGWYTQTGFYTNVQRDHYYLIDPSVDKLKAVIKNDQNAIAWFVKTKILRKHYPIHEDWIPSLHVIGITSTPVIDEAKKTIKFEYWTWGVPPREIEDELDFVRDCIMGIMVATLKSAG